MKRTNKVIFVCIAVMLSMILIEGVYSNRNYTGKKSFSIFQIANANDFEETKVPDDGGSGCFSNARCKCKWLTLEPNCIDGYLLSIQKPCNTNNGPFTLCSVGSGQCN